MIVKNLIEALGNVDPEMEIYLASDEEGNSFMEVQEVLEHNGSEFAEYEAREDKTYPKFAILWPSGNKDLTTLEDE